jgi:hypothetical protein
MRLSISRDPAATGWLIATSDAFHLEYSSVRTRALVGPKHSPLVRIEADPEESDN